MNRAILILILLISSGGSILAQVFSERSAAIGINHAYSARGLTGGGVAFFDYDNDGDEDIYLTGGRFRDIMYKNNGDGSYSKVLDDIGLVITQRFNTIGVATGDIDNDGDRDMMVTTWEEYRGFEEVDGRHLLFLNNGNGTFDEIGETAGITHEAFGMGAAFLDYNKDGLLDIYVMNHIERQEFTFDANGAVNGYAHDCYPNFFYKNNGNLTFSEIASEMGMDNLGCTIAAAPTDYDMDGDLDLYIANDFGYHLTPNVLYKNNYPENSFEDVSESSGADVPAFGMGIAAGDFDQDLDFDYYVTNIGRNILIENDGNGSFTDITTAAGVENTEVAGDGFTTGWGTVFFDVDNDSWLDLYVANGRIPSLPTFPTAIMDPDKLYLNKKDKTFEDVSDAAGVADVSYGRGMAYSDFDKDGDLDIFVVVLDEFGAKSKFYVNETVNDNHYVQFKLTGKVSNRDAYGSKLWLYAGGKTFVREILGGGSSHASQATTVVHYGLGDIDQIDSLRIDWPNGHVDHLGAFGVDALHEIEEGIITNIETLETTLGIKVSPNPFDDQIFLTTKKQISEPVLIELYAMDGRTIFSRKIQIIESNEIEVPSSLPSGIYTLSIRTESGVGVQKIMKR